MSTMLNSISRMDSPWMRQRAIGWIFSSVALTLSAMGCGDRFRADEIAGAGAKGGAEPCSSDAGCGGGESGSGGSAGASSGGEAQGNSGGTSAGSGMGGTGTGGQGTGGSGTGGATAGANGGGTAGAAGGTGHTACAATSRFVFEDCERASTYFEASDPLGVTVNGGWASLGDPGGSAVFGYAELARPEGGAYVMRCLGAGFTEWGGGCLAAMGGGYNAAAPGFNAIEFWARSASSIDVRVDVPDRTSSPNAGVCDSAETCVSACCHDNYGATVTIGSDWTRYTLRFDELVRTEGKGPPLSFDPTYMRGFNFVAPPGTDFELYFDDLGFVVCPTES